MCCPTISSFNVNLPLKKVWANEAGAGPVICKPYKYTPGLIPFVIVLLGLILFYKKNFFIAFKNIGYVGIFYAISFTICNITFIISIQNTNVANTLIMVAMAPMLSAFLGAFFLKEIPDKKTWIAIALTLLSVLYIFCLLYTSPSPRD